MTVHNVCVVLAWMRHQQDLLCEQRDEAITVLAAAGLSYEEIGRHAGLTRGRVGQIVTSRR